MNFTLLPGIKGLGGGLDTGLDHIFSPIEHEPINLHGSDDKAVRSIF